MKRFLAIVLVIVISLSAVACGNDIFGSGSRPSGDAVLAPPDENPDSGNAPSTADGYIGTLPMTGLSSGSDQWEYMITIFSGLNAEDSRYRNEATKELNELGKDGWELATAHAAGSNYMTIYTLKRKLS